MGVIRPHPCRIKLLVDLLVFRRVLMLRRCGPEQKPGSHQANDAAPSDHEHHSGHDPGTTRDSGGSLSPQPPEEKRRSKPRVARSHRQEEIQSRDTPADRILCSAKRGRSRRYWTFRNCVSRSQTAKAAPFWHAALRSPDKNAEQPSAAATYGKLRLKPEQKLPTFIWM